MIRYIKGILEYSHEGDIIVDNNGIGYRILVPLSIYASLPSIGQEVKIFTYQYVREDALKLFGFLSNEDLLVFEKLISVNGIGPKGALGILSALTTEELKVAIINEDDKAISKAPGIGKKTAQRLIIDLKDKLDLQDYERMVTEEINEVKNGNDIRQEAVTALVSLGYTSTEANNAIRKISNGNTVEDLIKQALKSLSIF